MGRQSGAAASAGAAQHSRTSTADSDGTAVTVQTVHRLAFGQTSGMLDEMAEESSRAGKILLATS
jgi:uncharacterized membrane protein YgdD (TMEM256/DUF423 family)